MVMNSDPNLIISDDYTNEVGNTCRDRGGNLDDAMNSYLSLLDQVASEAIPSGAQHDALVAFTNVARQLYGGKTGTLKETSKTLQTTCEDFIAEVDADDQFRSLNGA
ncbi:hypothetical protein OZX74_00685 [Bifidobacterium sp. ESL0798]|uniref:hypothetical protein n=1 Tax=Bifidobacterium sp. ESL0798 TaxID=2983235 RepID=UPI0023F98636|nr:hypothetical protein [Bifidobacterium sp. ESL0798]WEV74119.1 hypothetical protein OZX74_00685 [Bifidobacterium sp. ESL0798]